MSGPVPTQDEQRAIDLVVAALTQASLQPPDWEWRARPLEDGWVVSPVTRARGAGTFVVRNGQVRHVPSSRTVTEEDVYRQLVTEQG